MTLALFGLVIFILSFVIGGLNRQTSEKTNLAPSAWFARVIGGLMFFGGVIWACAVIVPAGYKGVLLHFGAVRGQKSEGFHLVVPFVQEVVLMEVRTQKEQSEASAASKDLQIVSTTLALNFRIDSNKVATLYRNVGKEYKARIIDPAVQESIKVVTAQYTAEELIKLRARVKSEVEQDITERLGAYNIIVEPAGLSITNFDFSPEFNKAIEQKQVAQQQAEQQRYILQKAELEKQTAITIAEGKSESAKLNAEALRVQGGSLVIAREWIEKWNGTLPAVYGGGQGMIIDLGTLLRDQPVAAAR